MGSGAEQAVSRVAESREGDRMARKKEDDVCSISETGVQLRKVELERKVVKKPGQEAAVKLLPTEVSNGEGRGVAMTVMEGAESEEVDVGGSFSDEDSDVEADGDESVDVDVDSAGSEEVLVVSPKAASRVSCLRASQRRG